MKEYRVVIRGIRPLLHKRFPSPEESVLKVKRNSVFDAQEEIEKCLYRDKNGEIYQPTNHIEGAIIKGATQIQFKGKKTYKDLAAQGLTVVEQRLYFKNPTYQIDLQTSVIPSTRGRVPVARPRWDEWEFEFTLHSEVDGDIGIDTLKSILTEAGKVGIGTYRLKFGKFKVVSVEEIKQ